jgi:hypothetical protein
MDPLGTFGRVRWLAVLLVFGVATVAGLWVAAETKVGPILFALNERHGVHVGDVAAFVVAYTWALVLSLLVLVPPRRC